MKQYFFGVIDKGEFKLENRDKFLKYLNLIAYKTQPTKIELTVRRYRKPRSRRQNNLYWLYLTVIAKETGEDDIEGLHQYFKSQYLVDRSKRVPRVMSTTELSTMEMYEYMGKIERLMGEMGITLPDPSEYY